MKQQRHSSARGRVNMAFYRHQDPQPAAALETGLIFTALLIAVSIALYVLKTQLMLLL